MKRDTTHPWTGPLDEHPWPERLAAHVVSPGPEPRVHGYAVHDDLAPNYSFAELMLLTLTGALPDRERGRAFEVCLAFLAPTTVAQAPAHVAVISRMIGARTSGLIGAAAIATAEQARELVSGCGALLASLSEGPLTAPPPGLGPPDPEERAAVRRLWTTLHAHGVDAPAPAPELGLLASLVVALHGLGLVRPDQIEAAITLARLPCVLAEGLAVQPGAFAEYPVNLPTFLPEVDDD